MIKQESDNSNNRQIDLELDRLERQINETRVLYEQYFIDLLPRPPEPEVKNIKQEIRRLLKAPFKNSQSKFRLRQLITRFQTYATYWERVNKQREEGTYSRDVFRAKMRAQLGEETKARNTKKGAAERSMEQLFNSYQNAIKKTGSNTDNLNFESFKNTLINRAKYLKKEHGINKLSYKVVKRGDKIVIKASSEKDK